MLMSITSKICLSIYEKTFHIDSVQLNLDLIIHSKDLIKLIVRENLTCYHEFQIKGLLSMQEQSLSQRNSGTYISNYKISLYLIPQ